MSALRVLVVDEQTTLRRAVCRLLRQEPDIVVVGEASTGAQAQYLVADLKPDIVVIDLHLPDQDGIETLQYIRRLSPMSRIVVLTARVTDHLMLLAIATGALGVLLKTIHPRALVAAVRAAANGTATLAPLVATRLYQVQTSQEFCCDQEESVLLRRLAAGETISEIARALETTVVALQLLLIRLANRVLGRGSE